MSDLFNSYNTVAWILSNLLIIYIGFVLVLFVIGYAAVFDPRSTTGGRLIFQFTASLIGVIGIIFIGVFVNPQMNRLWWNYANDIFWWRPTLRLLVFGYVGYTITSLVILLAKRRFFPERVKLDHPDETTLVKPRQFRNR